MITWYFADSNKNRIENFDGFHLLEIRSANTVGGQKFPEFFNPIEENIAPFNCSYIIGVNENDEIVQVKSPEELGIHKVYFDTRRYRVGLMSDVHYNDTSDVPNSEVLGGSNLFGNEDMSLKNALSFYQEKEEIDMVCIAGDVSTDRMIHVRNFREMIDKYCPNKPVFICKGNHDNSASFGRNSLWLENTIPSDDVNPYELHFFNETSQEEGDGTSFWFEKPVNGMQNDIYIFFNVNYASVSTFGNGHWYGYDDMIQLQRILDEHRNQRCYIFTHQFFPNKSGTPCHDYTTGDNGDAWPEIEYTRNGNGHDWGYYLNWYQFKYLNELNNYYKNSIWFTGHSHYQWRWQCASDRANICNYDYLTKEESDILVDNIGPLSPSYRPLGYNTVSNVPDNKYKGNKVPLYKRLSGYNVHIPSTSRPLRLGKYYQSYDIATEGNTKNPENSNTWSGSEGGILDVYDDYVDIRGIVFKDENDPKGSYRNKYCPIATYRLPVGGKNIEIIESKNYDDLVFGLYYLDEEDFNKRYNNRALKITSEGPQTLSVFNMLNTPNLEISFDNESWTAWDYHTIDFDGSIYVRGNNLDGLSESSQKYTKFVFGTDSPVYITGDLMNLISYTDIVTEIPCKGCFTSLFSGCDQLVQAPSISATIYKDYCFEMMYMGCTNLKYTSKMVDAQMGAYSCLRMYSGCTSLESAEELPATTLARNCYEHMFEGCTSLLTQPNILATEVAEKCCLYMFNECHSMKIAKTINIEECAPYCYKSMYNRCLSLTEAPELPATKVAEGCYHAMFHTCVSLEEGPALPATELIYENDNLYMDGPQGTTVNYSDEPTVYTKEQEELEKIHSQYLTIEQYNHDYNNIDDGIGDIEDDDFGIGGIEDEDFGIDCGDDGFLIDEESIEENGIIPMVDITEDDFVPGSPEAIAQDKLRKSTFYYKTTNNSLITPNTLTGWGDDVSYVSNSIINGEGKLVFNNPITYIPSDVFKDNRYITYAGIPSETLHICNSAFNSCQSLEKIELNWKLADIQNKAFGYCHNLSTVGINGVDFTDYNKLYSALSDMGTSVASDAFVDIPLTHNDLPTISEEDTAYDVDFARHEIFGCYAHMFYNCKKLKGIKGDILPAMKLSNYCYTGMFGRCKSMTKAPELPALIMKPYCYADMFMFSNLKECPNLPATILAKGCYGSWFGMPGLLGLTMPYGGMFRGCSDMTVAPDVLPATALEDECYHYMFAWSGISKAPLLPALTAKSSCYKYMFSNCTTLSNVQIMLHKTNGVSGYLTGAFTNVPSSKENKLSYYYLSYTSEVFAYLPKGWSNTSIQEIPYTKSISIDYKSYTETNPISSGTVAFTNKVAPNSIIYDNSTKEGSFTSYIYAFDDNLQISYKGFENKAITEITIPDNVRSIDKYAFHGCKRLTDIHFNDNLLKLGSSSFNGCTSLEHVDLPNSIETIDSSVFYGCEMLKSIVLPKNLRSIGTYIFYNCKSLEEVTLSPLIDVINENMFSYCEKLVKINGKIRIIKSRAFSSCTKLDVNSINWDNVEEMESNAFSYTKFKYFKWPKKCLTINPIFGDITTIDSIYFPSIIDFSEVSRMPELRYDDSLPFKITDDLMIIVPDSLYGIVINDEGWSVYRNYIISYTEYIRGYGDIINTLSNIDVNNTVGLGMYVRARASYSGGSTYFKDTNNINLQGIKDLGCDWVYELIGSSSETTIKKRLSDYQKVGLGVYLDGYWDCDYSNSIKSAITKVLGTHEYDDVFKGFMVCDEPHEYNIPNKYTYSRPACSFQEVNDRLTTLSKLPNAENHINWVNCFPNYANEGQITNAFYGYVYNGKLYTESENGEYKMYLPNNKYPTDPTKCTFAKISEITDFTSYSTENYTNTYSYPLVSDEHYLQYVRGTGEMASPVLSGDYYGIRANDVVRPNQQWIRYLNTFRQVSLETGKPHWQYFCSSEHNGYAKPSVRNMKYNMYINMVYGASTLIYYLYADYDNVQYKNSVFDYYGMPSPLFEPLKNVIFENIKPVGSFIKQGTITNVNWYNTVNDDIKDFIEDLGQGEYVISQLTISHNNYIIIFGYDKCDENTITLKNVKYEISTDCKEFSKVTNNEIIVPWGDIRIFVI